MGGRKFLRSTLSAQVFILFLNLRAEWGRSGGDMEPFTVSGAQLSLSDLYSVIPFNITTSTSGSSNNNNTEAPGPVRSAGGLVIAISITALYSVICVVGLLGNVLVMYGVVR